MKTFASLPALAVAFALSASALHAQSANPVAFSPAPDSAKATHELRTAELQVTNNNWLDVHLYVDRDGLLMPLGVVTTGQTQKFMLPAMAMVASGDVRIVAAPIGGSDLYVSPDLIVSPGDAVNMSVENSLPLSTAVVMPNG